MKFMKKMFAVIAAMTMLATTAMPAMAITQYTEVTLQDIAAPELKEKLAVDSTNSTNPAVTYTLTLSSDMKIYEENGVKYGHSDGVEAPLTNETKVASVSFTAAEVTGINSKTKNYNLEPAFVEKFKAMTFNRPGIYYWTISKTCETDSSFLSNNNRSQGSPNGTALVVRINDVEGVLTPIVSLNETDKNGLPTGAKDPTYEDNYSATVNNFVLKKEVTGNQGARDQYFCFDVSISGIPSMATHKYTIDTTLGPGIMATPKYGENGGGTHTNPTFVEISNEGAGSFKVWLKDQEQITVENLHPTASITITESAYEGYTPAYSYSYKDQDGQDVSENVPGDNSLEIEMPHSQLRTVFKNEKKTASPTGITLQKAAPAAGIVMALGLASVMVIGKRRREND